MGNTLKILISIQFVFVVLLASWNVQQHLSIVDIKNRLYKQVANGDRQEAKLPVKIDMDKLVAGSLTYGPDNAKIKIVKFNSFSCGYCAKASVILKKIVEKYPDSIQIVYRHFNRVKIDRLSAQALECASDKGYFWKMYHALFSKRIGGADDIYDIATSIGISRDYMKSCVLSNKFLTKTNKDTALGQEVGVRGTPSFFINGKAYPGFRPFEDFDAIIKSFL